MKNSAVNKVPAVFAVAAAYVLLLVLWMASIGVSHTYAHWIEGFQSADLPRLTVAVLGAIGVTGAPPAATVIAKAAWLLFAAFPGICLVVHLRSSSCTPGSTLALLLIAWLFALFAVCVLVAVGLWLPFSLL